MPFVTGIASKGLSKNPLEGDFNIVAAPPGTPNRWNLTPVESPDQPAPIDIDLHPYMARYGYRKAPKATT